VLGVPDAVAEGAVTLVSFTVPIKASTTLNTRAHWAEKARRAKAERAAVAYRWPRLDIEPVVTVTLTRIGPRELDGDNLTSALKGIRDGVAAKLRLDDACRLVAWCYRQERGEPAVRVELDVPMRREP